MPKPGKILNCDWMIGHETEIDTFWGPKIYVLLLQPSLNPSLYLRSSIMGSHIAFGWRSVMVCGNWAGFETMLPKRIHLDFSTSPAPSGLLLLQYETFSPFNFLFKRGSKKFIFPNFSKCILKPSFKNKKMSYPGNDSLKGMSCWVGCQNKHFK